LETFEEGALALVIRGRQLVELNQVAADIICRMEEGNGLLDISASLARCHEISLEQASQDVLSLCKELESTGVLESQPDIQLEENSNMETNLLSQYTKNPEVVLREEDPDEGALLFNPDTAGVKVLNSTGLFIWQYCEIAHTFDEIVKEVQKGFDEVPIDSVAKDVREFVDGMIDGGFIGILEIREDKPS